MIIEMTLLPDALLSIYLSIIHRLLRKWKTREKRGTAIFNAFILTLLVHFGNSRFKKILLCFLLLIFSFTWLSFLYFSFVCNAVFTMYTTTPFQHDVVSTSVMGVTRWRVEKKPKWRHFSSWHIFGKKMLTPWKFIRRKTEKRDKNTNKYTNQLTKQTTPPKKKDP